MKSLLFASIILLSLNFSLSAQNFTKKSLSGTTEIITDSLVAFYPFNGNAGDSSGFGNDGEVFGATLTADRFGNLNSAYEFDGTNDYIVISDSDGLTPSNQKMSISVWFSAGFPGDKFILYKGSSTSNREYAMGVRIDSVGSFQINRNGSANDRASVRTHTKIKESKWNHMVGVWDGTQIKIYLNNELEQVIDTSFTIGNFGSDLFIGTYGGSISQYAFNGKIDDLRIYNAALDLVQINDLYAEGGWPLPPDTAGAVADTLVAHYPFNGNAGDSSGFGNDGEIFGATLTADRFGNLNSAYEFDGINDYINLGNKSSLDITGDLTLSVWAKGVSSTDVITALIGKTNFEQGNGGGIGPYGLGIDDGDQLYFYVRNSDENLPLTIQNAETNSQVWNHYLGVFKAGTFMKFYKNGDLIENITEQIPTRIDSSSRSLVIGVRTNTSNQSVKYYFDGSIDDVRVYSKAVTDSTIQELYTEGGWPLPQVLDTLVAHYPFTGNALDSSGFGNDGEVFGATLTADRFGNLNSAYEFDGTNDYIVISDSDGLTPSNQKMSISVWFSAGFPGDKFILYKGSSTSNREYAMGVRIDSVGSFQINRNGSANDRASVRTHTKIKESKWNHMVGVWDGTQIKIYLNNELEQVIDTSFTIGNFGSDLFIGTYGGSISQYAFNGKIDDLRIYNAALDLVQINDLYAEGGWPLPPDTAGAVADTLVAHYPFNGNAGDSSGFGNHGEVFGATLAADRFGNLNSAYVFDGDDYINFGSSDSIEFAKSDFSISVWVRPVFNGNEQYQILRKGLDHKTNGEARWALGLNSQGKIRMIFEDADQGDSTLVEFGETVYSDNNWHHIAAIFDRDSSLRVFVDNELELETNRIKDFSGFITNLSPLNLYAGRDNTGNPTRGFIGSMDDIRIYSYALSEVAIQQLFAGGDNVVVSNNDDGNDTPKVFQLDQNYPNPFNPSTQIKYSIEKTGFVQLNVYDITGRLISRIVDGNKSAGKHSATFNGANLASGIYIYELKANGKRAIKRFTLIK